MAEKKSARKPQCAAFVVLRETAKGQWQMIAEVQRRPGLTARAARAQAVSDATGGEAKADQAYAAVLRSEWRIAMEL